MWLLLLSVCHLVRLSVSSIAHDRRPNVVGVGNGWPSRSELSLVLIWSGCGLASVFLFSLHHFSFPLTNVMAIFRQVPPPLTGASNAKTVFKKPRFSTNISLYIGIDARWSHSDCGSQGNRIQAFEYHFTRRMNGLGGVFALCSVLVPFAFIVSSYSCRLF